MDLPDISRLHLNGTSTLQTPRTHIPDDINKTSGNHDMEKLKEYARSLPYSIEPYSKMLKMLDFILLRITQCVEAKDYDIGLLQWDSMLT